MPLSLFARIRLAVSLSNEQCLAGKDTKALWRGNTAQCIDRILFRTCNVQQQEASHDAEIFVKAIHAIDSIRTCFWWLQFHSEHFNVLARAIERARAAPQGIAEVLGVTGDLPGSEFHDAHRARW
jgi:hypothetical protein